MQSQTKESKSKQEQKEKAPSFFSELGIFMKPYTGQYVLSIVLSVVSVVAYLGSYAFAGALVVALLAPEISMSAVIWSVVGCIVCKCVYAILLNVSTWISHSAAYKTLKDIRLALLHAMRNLPLGYFEKSGSGRLKTLLADHVESMEKTLAHMLPELTANTIAPLIMLVWMFFIDWRLALIALIWIILGFSVTGGMMKDYDTKFAGQIAADKAMNQAVVEFVRGIEVIKNFGRADECYKKYQDAVQNHADYNIGWQHDTQKYTALGMAIAPFALFPVLIAGVIFYGQGSLAPETLFMMLILILGIFGPLMRSSMYFDQVAQMGVQAQEINNVLGYPQVSRGTVAAIDNATIAFDHVSFSYASDNAPVQGEGTASDAAQNADALQETNIQSPDMALNDISLMIPQGTMCALVGPSGSGKSTIAKLLAGYWDPGSGHIRIGSHELSEYSQDALNDAIAYVDQDTFLFNLSIMDNIRMGKPQASDEEVVEAAQKCGCDTFIRNLPQGYDTLAGTAGAQLSGGERQRICIARAMMKQAPIMILDEATSSSDPENEASIQDALSVAMQGKTLLVIAHRLPTIVHADAIAYVNDGRIEALGTHDQLCETCPAYASMWALSQGDAR